jgi:hypothetical protein
MPEELPQKMSEIQRELGVSHTYMSALKKAMGIGNARYGFKSRIAKYLKENPNFRMADVYHRPGCACANCAAKKANPSTRRGRPRKSASLDEAGSLVTA